MAVSEASVRQLSMQVCVQAGYALIALHTLNLTIVSFTGGCTGATSS